MKFSVKYEFSRKKKFFCRILEKKRFVFCYFFNSKIFHSAVGTDIVLNIVTKVIWSISSGVILCTF